jgi:hypothetical protein
MILAVRRAEHVPGLIDNGWFISLVSIILTFFATLGLQRLTDWIQARHGVLRGTYIAVSQVGSPRSGTAEVVRCKHVGTRLEGEIEARASFAPGREKSPDVECAHGLYHFSGRVLERQILLTYWSTERASQFSGTMTMTMDGEGRKFKGIWCGASDSGSIVSGRSIWNKADYRPSDVPKGEIVKAINEFCRTPSSA